VNLSFVGLANHVCQLVSVLADCWNFYRTSPSCIVEGLEIGHAEDGVIFKSALFVQESVVGWSGSPLSDILCNHEEVSELITSAVILDNKSRFWIDCAFFSRLVSSILIESVVDPFID